RDGVGVVRPRATAWAAGRDGRENPTSRSRPGCHDLRERSGCNGCVLNRWAQFSFNTRWLWCAGWLIAAVWAAVFALIPAPQPHRVWGMSAGAGYLCAAVAALVSSRRRGPAVSVWFAAAGAVVVPFVLLLLTGSAQSEVGVMERAGLLTVR